MDVGLQRESWVAVPRVRRQGAGVHAVGERHAREVVSQRVKAVLGYLRQASSLEGADFPMGVCSSGSAA